MSLSFQTKSEFHLPKVAIDLVRLTPQQAHDRILEGIPLKRLWTTIDTLKMSPTLTAGLMAVEQRTMQRWKKDKKKTLDPVQGGRFYRMVKIVQEGVDIFGSEEASLEWLNDEQPSLDFRKPIEMMRTEPGAARVEQVLLGIRHGVYL